MSYFGQQYPLYVPPSISGNEKVKITTTTRTTMTETVPLTREVVIFGATGDLCRRKLIPALYNLHTKGLLPDNLVIVGTSRREISKDAWLSRSMLTSSMNHSVIDLLGSLVTLETLSHWVTYLGQRIVPTSCRYHPRDTSLPLSILQTRGC